MTHKTTLDRDATTKPLGSHPVGTGVGAAAGGIAGAAAAGAVAGSSVGPVGTVVGAVAGAVVGGLAGKGIAELIDPAAEEAYWRDTYSTRPYVARGASFDDYGPAYRYGVDSYGRYDGRTFDEVEADLSRDWQRAKGSFEALLGEREACDARLLAARQRRRRARDSGRLRSRRQVMATDGN